MKFNKEADEACIKKWRELLARFSVLIENNPSPDKIQKELIALKEDAKNCNLLTFRQIEMLVARVDNYLSARYGRSKDNINFKAA